MAECKKCGQKTWWVTNEDNGRVEMVNPNPMKMMIETAQGYDGESPKAKPVTLYQTHYWTCEVSQKEREEKRANNQNNAAPQRKPLKEDDIPF